MFDLEKAVSEQLESVRGRILAFYVAKPIYTKKENDYSGARRDTDDAYANRPPEEDIQF